MDYSPLTESSSPPWHIQELKQDISSFRYEVLDLLGNRKPNHRTYSSSSEATQDEPAETDDHKEEDGSKDADNRYENWGRSCRSKASTSFTQSHRRSKESQFSVSSLFKSMSGLEWRAKARPESNGLGKDMPPSFVHTSNLLHRFSRSKKSSLRRLGTLMTRMNGHMPQQSAYSISDRVPQADWHGPPMMSELTRSELHLHVLGLRSTETEQNLSTSRHANGKDRLLLGTNSPTPLHCASSLTASSADMCRGWMGPCDSLGSSNWDQEESVTTQL